MGWSGKYAIRQIFGQADIRSGKYAIRQIFGQADIRSGRYWVGLIEVSLV
jgi:hypothetical protein